MRFWKETDETKLERELRAQRPQPRDEFVRRLSRQVTPLRRRRLALPKVALVGAITATLAASLGAAGALGEGGNAVHSFTSSVSSLVSPPKLTWVTAKPTTPAAQPTPSSSSSGSTTSSSTEHTRARRTRRAPPRRARARRARPATRTPSRRPTRKRARAGDDDDDNPYKHQYGHKLKICWHGEIIEINSNQLFWYLLHGARPPGLCLKWRPYPDP